MTANDKTLPFGRYVDGIITRSWNDKEKKIGSATIPVIQLVLRFDDETLPNDVNGKEVLVMVRIDPKAAITRRFCSYLHRRKILEFSEEHRERSKTSGMTKMADHLVESADLITGVWDNDARVLNGGKLVGNRLSFIISKITAWADPNNGRNYPNNWRYVVHHPSEDVKPVVFNIFEISHIEDVGSGEGFINLSPASTEEVETSVDEDDVRWEYSSDNSTGEVEEPF